MRFILFVLAGLTCHALAADWVTLFNGRDLSGWTNVNCAPETWSAREGVIYCTGKPTGALRSLRQYENFIFELEWRHLSSGGNSGIFIWASPIAALGGPFLRSIEVQVLDIGFNIPGKNEWYTTHGDVFPIHGSTMEPFGRHNGQRSFPSEERSKPSPEWNHYRIACSNGVIRLSVNGKEVSGGSHCNYRKGYIGLEAEGAPVEFRNVRLQELPPGDATKDATAPLDPGWRSLFTGLDLRGWRTNAAVLACWSVEGERLHSSGTSPVTLWTSDEFGDVEFTIDCRPAKRNANEAASPPMVQFGRPEAQSAMLPLTDIPPGAWQRIVLTRKGNTLTLQQPGVKPREVTLPSASPAKGALGLKVPSGGAEFMNLHFRNL